MSDKEEAGVGKKVWLALLKKADDATPARISFLKQPLHQGLAVLVLFVAFFVAFLVSIVSNTAGCSVENGCVSCSVESNVNAEVEAKYSLGCEPIAVPSFGLEQLNGCASGLVKNDKAELMELASAGEEFVSKLTALCKSSVSALCSDGTTALKDFNFDGANNHIGACMDEIPSQCMAQNNAYESYRPNEATAFIKEEAKCDGIFDSWVNDWKNSLVSEALRKAAVWSSTDSLIDFNVEELKKLHTAFGLYTPTKMKSVAVGYMIKMAQIKCWIDQMHAEIVSSPDDYPKSSSMEPKLYGHVRFVPFMADGNPASTDPTQPNPSKALLLKPGEFSGTCGYPVASLATIGEYDTSVYGGNNWWVASIQEVQPVQPSAFNTVVSVQSLAKTVCRREVKEPTKNFNYEIDELCADQNQYRATGTGEFSCCSEMSATNVLSAGYAFAGAVMSAVGLLVAVAVYALCGKAMVDMNEFKKAAKGASGDAKEITTVASSAADGV